MSVGTLQMKHSNKTKKNRLNHDNFADKNPRKIRVLTNTIKYTTGTVQLYDHF